MSAIGDSWVKFNFEFAPPIDPKGHMCFPAQARRRAACSGGNCNKARCSGFAIRPGAAICNQVILGELVHPQVAGIEGLGVGW